MTLENRTIQLKYILQKKFNLQKLNAAFYCKTRWNAVSNSATGKKYAHRALSEKRMTRVTKISLTYQALRVTSMLPYFHFLPIPTSFLVQHLSPPF